MSLFASIKAKGATVKIYTVKNRGRDYFKLSYLWAGIWQQKMLRHAGAKDADRARYTAREIALAVATGRGAEAPDVTSSMRLLRAAEDSLSLSGVPIDIAARDYAQAREIIGPDGNLIEAAIFYAKNKGNIKQEIATRDAVEMFIEAQRSDGASTAYIHDLRPRLRRFARDNGGLLSEVTSTQVKAWLRALSVAPRTRNNYLALVKTLFNWAKTEGYLARNIPTELEEIAKVSAPTTIVIHDLETVAKVMSGALEHDPVIIPYLALGYFAGIRPNEMRRMTGASIRWEHSDIEIKDWQAKGTRRRVNRRIVPMQPNLAAWLRAYPPATGPKPLATTWTQNRVFNLCKKIDIDWGHDIMRHTAISNLVALTSNVDQVALWAGNSRQVIYGHYLSQVTGKEAARYFAIAPPALKRIITFKS